ncbi:MAG: PAS domain S-box protein [Planctomycetota bacterium]|jgi:PAS domain S-box-containing protein
MRGSNETEASRARKPVSAGRVRGRDSVKGGVSLKIFAPAIVFTVIMLGTLVWFGWYFYQHLRIVGRQHFRAVQLIGIITHLDEVLTMSARMGAATGDSQWEERYKDYEPELDDAIKELTGLAPEAIMSEAAIQTDSANVALVAMEKSAFELVREGNLSEAKRILYSAEYDEQKRIYSGGMTDFTEALQAHTATELRRRLRQILIAALFVAASASVVLLGWVHMLRERRHFSQRRKTEKTFRASEERLTTFLDSAPSTFITFDRNLNLTAINGAGFEMSGGGLTKDEFIGKNMRDFYPGLEESEEYQEYLEVIEKGKTVFVDDVCLGPKFGDIHVSVSAFKTFGGLGLIVTNRSEAERTLLQSEEKYRRLIANIPDVVWTTDSEGNTIFISANVEEVYGYSPEEIYSQGSSLWLGRIHSDDEERVKEAFTSLFQKDVPLDLEYRIQKKSGEWMWLHDRSVATYEREGVRYADGIFTDVTKRKEAEQEARTSQTLMQGILDTTDALVIVRDIEGRYLYVNKQVEDILGMKSEEITGKTPFEVHSKAKAEAILADDKRVIASGKLLDIEDELEVRGETRAFLGSKFPLLDAAGNLYAVCTAVGDMTNYRKAEDALRRSREGMAIAQRVAHIGSWERDLNTGKVVWSDEAFRLLGLEPGEIEPNFEVFVSYVHPEDKDRVRQAVDSAIADSPFRVEFRVIRADGVERIFEGQSELVRDSKGKPSRILGICQDITERKKAQDEVLAERNKLQSVADTIQCGLTILDLDYNITYQNEYLSSVFGEHIGEKCYRIFEGKNQICEGCPVELAVKDGKSHTSIREVVMPSGETNYWENVASPIRDSDGKIISCLEVSTNITDRIKTEEALRESEERYRTVVENAGETIAVIGKGGVFQFMNRTGAERLGGKPEDYTGKTMWEVFPKEIADRQAGSVEAVINTGQGMNFVTPTELQGEMRWYNTTVEPLRDSSGEATAVLIIARDIHEIRQAEMELDAYSDKMTQAERLASLGTISATLAHELTQPLTVISLSIEDSLTELEGVSCPRAVKDELRDSLKEVGNVTAIVERFRNFARKSSAKTVNKVKLKAVAERIFKLLSKSAQQANLDLHLKGVDKLPTVYFNEKEMEQLFFALIQNSIQASDGKDSHNLFIEGSVKNDYIELRFKDDCGGIRREDADSIFEPFFTTKAAGEGTGLGLCIVQRVAERSGGQVRVDNRPGEGLTIVVTLGISEKRTS